MRFLILLAMPALMWAQASPGSLYSASGPLANPARDTRAAVAGDVVTIVVSDQASASATGGTNTSRQSSGNAKISALAGTISAGNPLGSLLDFSNQRKLNGQGETTREMTLTTTISARVISTTPSGLLVVEGTKQTVVNSERQMIVVRGLVRAVDVTPSNTIRSDQIADLMLEVNGKGVVNDAIKRPFILYRILLGFLPF
ncbi:MAG: flagellar basal body L-ring protein FlgH [Acidobacteriota bacterium]